MTAIATWSVRRHRHRLVHLGRSYRLEREAPDGWTTVATHPDDDALCVAIEQLATDRHLLIAEIDGVDR